MFISEWYIDATQFTAYIQHVEDSSIIENGFMSEGQSGPPKSEELADTWFEQNRIHIIELSTTNDMSINTMDY